MSFLFPFTITKDLFLLLNLKIDSGWIIASSILMSLIATRNALKGPRLKQIPLYIENVPDELDGFKIAHISDLHIGHTIGKKYVKNVVNKINEIKPDLIALTGDIGDGSVKKNKEAIDQLGKLKSTLGVFFVPGNHEYYWDANEWMNALNNAKIIVLLNRGKILNHNNQKILISGIPDPVSKLERDIINPIKINPHAPLKILLSHRPDIAEDASINGYNLQLSGHTHGGQFFPWTFIVRFFHKNFKGIYQINKMWLNVNPGTGNWGPFMRLGTETEISVIEINTKKSLDRLKFK